MSKGSWFHVIQFVITAALMLALYQYGTGVTFFKVYIWVHLGATVVSNVTALILLSTEHEHTVCTICRERH